MLREQIKMSNEQAQQISNMSQKSSKRLSKCLF